MNLHDAALQVLRLRDPADKVRATADTAARWRAGELTLGSDSAAEPLPVPGRPDKPELVAPRALAQRGLGTPAGRAAFLHAVAHIEFNAINLGWDAVYRFRDMPRPFYDDWVGVADDEARHFTLLQARLREFGHGYDPVFQPDGESRTFGEMTEVEKHGSIWTAPGPLSPLVCHWL